MTHKGQRYFHQTLFTIAVNNFSFKPIDFYNQTLISNRKTSIFKKENQGKKELSLSKIMLKKT